jgi:hypothetical protein
MTSKEKKFTLENAVQLLEAKIQKNLASKVYDVLNSHGKQCLEKNKKYTWQNKGKVISLEYTTSERTSFDTKKFAEAHPKMYQNFMSTNEVVTINIK